MTKRTGWIVLTLVIAATLVGVALIVAKARRLPVDQSTSGNTTISSLSTRSSASNPPAIASTNNAPSTLESFENPQSRQNPDGVTSPGTGPWKLTAAIESYDETGPIYSGTDATILPTPDPPANHNVLAFLDNHRFIVADGLHPIRVVDADTGLRLVSFGNPTKVNYRLTPTVSSDGRLLVILPDDQPSIWNTLTGECVGTLPASKKPYAYACFLPGDHALATFSERPDGLARGQIQIWDLDDKKRGIILRKTIPLEDDAYDLETIGNYLFLKESHYESIFDGTGLNLIWQASSDSGERFFYFQPDQNGHSAQFGLLHLTDGRKDWRNFTPEVHIQSLPDVGEIDRWKFPIEEDPYEDTRGNAQYAISPHHGVLAVSQPGRINFYFRNGAKTRTFPGPSKYSLIPVTFIDENLAVVIPRAKSDEIQVIDISSGRVLAAIPNEDEQFVLSPDKHHLLVRRRFASVNDHLTFMNPPHRAIVVLWAQTGDYANPQTKPASTN